MQARRAAVEQGPREFGRLLDPDREDGLGIVLDRMELVRQPCRKSEPWSSVIRLMLLIAVAGMIPGITGLSTPSSRKVSTRSK